MSKQVGKSNIADDAARARKLLEKNAPAKVSGLNKGNFTLQQGVTQNLGEHAVVVILTEHSVHQYTISHPIGVTDGDEKLDWVINRTDYIPSMMVRKLDPGLGAVNQKRAKIRTQLAVEHLLLVEMTGNGGKLYHFYPNRADVDRNSLLEEARRALQEEQRRIRQEIEECDDRAKAGTLKNQLAQLTDPTKYLDETTAAAESNLRKFWNSEEVIEYIQSECPQDYRTLTGPYADEPQFLIPGAKGKTLDTVVNGISAKLAKVSLSGGTVGGPTPLSGGSGAESASASLNVPAEGDTPPPETRKRRSSVLKSAISKVAERFRFATLPPEPAGNPGTIKGDGVEEEKSPTTPVAAATEPKARRKQRTNPDVKT